ncbi:MAG TPA: IPT/TIG domain-containing protein, partial [Solirubrobacteraceae bacterium]
MGRLKWHVGMSVVMVLAAGGVFASPVGATSSLELGAAPQTSPLLAAAPVVFSVSPTHGTSAGGTYVTVSGEGMKGVTTVYFGASEVVLPRPVSSKTKLKVFSPPGALGTVDITVSSPEGGTSAVTPADEYTYTSSPPVILKVSPDHGEGAGGRPVTITGENFTGATELHFGAQSASFTVKSAKAIKATVPPALALGATPVTVTTLEGTSEVTPASQYTYAAEYPTVESLNPDFGPAAGATVVSVEGKGFLGASKVVFDGKIPAQSF